MIRVTAMRWEDVEIQQPRLAELGRRKLGGPGVLLVGTIRVDGSPKAEVGRFHLFRVEVEDLTFIRWGSATTST